MFYDNARDLFVEVSHCPYIADHNMFGSRASLEVFSQGGTFVNNLVCGAVSIEPVVERPTPYHVPHSTQVAGYAAILRGDDRYIGNTFLGGDAAAAYGPGARAGQVASHGTAGYDGHPNSLADYLALADDPIRSDHERFMDAKQPVYIRDNVYGSGASPYERESGPSVVETPLTANIVREGDKVHLDLQLPEGFDRARIRAITGQHLERVRFVDADFEEPDGRPVVLDTNLIGAIKQIGHGYAPGPLAALGSTRTRTRFW